MISSKKITWIAVVLTAVAFCLTLGAVLLPDDMLSGNEVGTVSYSEEHTVTYSEEDYDSSYAAGTIAKITLKGTTASSESKNVEISGSDVTILGGGTYVLTGELTEGSLIVDSADGAVVRLVLNGASVTSSDFSALYVKQAAKVVISTVEGTENTFTDGAAYSEEKPEEGKPTAAIYSKDDLTLNGKGTLIVKGNYKDGIKVNDSLKITGGTLSVTAPDEGINVNDLIAFLDADITVSSGGDGVRCENEDADKGFMVLEDTKLSVTSGSDAIQSSSAIYLQGGEYTVESGDDAIHAETTLRFSPNTFYVTKCREGIEGGYIEIGGGDIRIISSDDAINAVGMSSSGSRFMPMGMHKDVITDEDTYLFIKGGNIHIETGGDGIDSNGAVRISGGHIEVYGPENSGNSSLDFEYGFVIDGGSLLATGSSGMAETPHETSGQVSIVYYLDETYEAGSTISVTDSAGNEIISAASAKSFDWICVSDAKLVHGETYTVRVNGNQVAEAEVTGILTTCGNRGRGMF